ncbi:unnamed protein product [Hermetia illucens]|uniref:Uncharacterized protein n=1 Tax=Hermetia illucens TaxID=343691 RepID=A0A7R8UCY2_HERIL|nr:unnamed protein product [Hermetia illucens]
MFIWRKDKHILPRSVEILIEHTPNREANGSIFPRARWSPRRESTILDTKSLQINCYVHRILRIGIGSTFPSLETSIAEEVKDFRV